MAWNLQIKIPSLFFCNDGIIRSEEALMVMERLFDHDPSIPIGICVRFANCAV